MSPRTTKRRRRTKAQLAAAGNGTPATLLSQVSELVNQNQALARENKELHSIIARVTQAVQIVSSSPRGSRRRLDEPGGRVARSRPDDHVPDHQDCAARPGGAMNRGSR